MNPTHILGPALALLAAVIGLLAHRPAILSETGDQG
jgi:hypothetical protein